MKYKIKKLAVGLSFVSVLFIGCGSSNSSSSPRTTFDKAYYSNIDYNNIDRLSTKFIGKDSRFVNLKTEIKLPKIQIHVWDKNYTIDNISEVQFDIGLMGLYSESEDYLYQQFEKNNLTYIVIDDKHDDKEAMVVSFDQAHILESNDNTMDEMSIITYTSDSLIVVYPETIIANGTAIVEYNRIDNFAVIKDGDLGLNVFNKMVDITQNYPNIKEIRLKNIAGSVHDDINMQTGLLLRKARLNTYVIDTESEDTDIASGGVDLFTAGVKRKIENQETVKLGIHSWAEHNMDGVTVEGKDFPKEHKRHHDQLLYFCKMLGVDVGYDFYFHTLEASDAENIHPMTDDELADYNILN